MEQHLTSQDLTAFAKGELPREAARAVIAHLLRGCTACRSESASRWHLGRSREALPEDAYDAGLARGLAVAQGGGGPLAASTAAAWLQEQAGVSAEVHGPDLVTSLLQRAWDLRHDNPEET